MTPDGKIILTGAEDNSVKLWQIESNLVSNNQLLINDEKQQQFSQQQQNNFKTSVWISSQIPQMIKLLEKLSEFDDDKIKDYINKNKNFSEVLNLASHGYYYYYIEKDQRKIPLINFLLYLDKIKLTKTFLKILEWTPNIRIPFGKDQYGITPFNIVHKRQLLTFDIFIKFCVNNKEKIPILDFDVDSILQLFPKENLTRAASELIDSQFIDIPLNNLPNEGVPEVYKLLPSRTPTSEDINQLFCTEQDTSNKHISTGKIINIFGIATPQNNFYFELQKFPMDHPIFKSQIISEINQVKWNEYGFQDYIVDVFKYLIFLILFTISIHLTREDPQMSDNQVILMDVFDGILLVFMLSYWMEEIQQLINFNLHYFATFWNYLDICFLFVTTFFLSLDLYEQKENPLELRILRAFSILIVWFKALSYTRAFEQTAFITRMLLAVFFDMKYFFITMAWILYGFTFALSRMQDRNIIEPETQNSFEMLQLMYKLLLGDFNKFDDILTSEKTGSETVIWILFFLCTLILMIIILNLLIAFINDSYNHVVEQKQVSFTFEQVQLLAQIDLQLSESKKKSLHKQFGEMYIFMVKYKSTDDENDNLSQKVNRLLNYQSEIIQILKKNSLEIKIGENQQRIETKIFQNNQQLIKYFESKFNEKPQNQNQQQE